MQTRTLALFLLAFLAATVHAADPSTVFGLELQKPFTVPECPAKHGIYSWPTDGKPCYEFDGFEEKGKNRPVTKGMLQLTWGPNAPQLAIGGTAIANVIDGRLEGISFYTLGIESQQRDLQALQDKYGEPTQSNVTHLQNAYGAQYLGVKAIWKLGEIVVTLDSGGLKSGVIRVETDKSAAERNAIVEQYAKRGPAL